MRIRSILRKVLGCGILSAGIIAGVMPRVAFAQGSQIPQGYNSQNWLTANADGQRDSWVRTDPHISVENMQKLSKFGVVRKVKLENSSAPGSLTSQVTSEASAGGYKSMGYLIDAAGTVVGFDSDTSQIFWKNPLGAKASAAGTCAGAVTPGIARVGQVLAPTSPPFGGIELGFRVRVKQPPGGGALGEPFRGAPNINDVAAPSAGATGPGFRAAGGGVFALAPDGLLHQLSLLKGFDFQLAPTQLVPPNASTVGLIAIDDFVYVASSNNCNGVPNGIWAVKPAGQDRSVATWKTNGGGIAGTVGPAFGTDGTIYAATGDGDAGSGSFSNSVVSLESKTLKLKDYFSPGKSEFIASPVVFARNGKDLIAAVNRDGKLYLLDSVSLGGVDHKTPLSTSARFTNLNSDYTPGALAAWQDAGGTQWVLASIGSAPASDTRFPVSNGNVIKGAIAAFKVVDQGGSPTLQPAWISRDMTSPLPPMIINGVIFALASGEYHGAETSLAPAQRVQRSTAAVLYALDGATGKELWNSGTVLSSPVHSTGLSSLFSTVYLTTTDNTLWAFGFPQDKQ